MKFISYIYTLFLQRFCSLFVKFRFKYCKSAAKKSYNPTCLVITFNSRHHDMMSIERYVGKSTIAFIYDVAYAQSRVNECRSWMYEPRRSKIGSSKEIVGECKYFHICSLTRSKMPFDQRHIATYIQNIHVCMWHLVSKCGLRLSKLKKTT